jgi:acetylglutamate kinase
MGATYSVNLIYCFEKKGVLSDPENDDSVISNLNPASYASYKASGVINKGMIPKLESAFEALHAGVKQVTICSADELLNWAVGTVITL